MSHDDDSVPDLPESWFKADLQFVDAVAMVVVAAVVPAVLFWFANANVVQWLLPSLIFIPLALGLRYGFFGGVAAALLVTGVLFAVPFFRSDVLPEFPKLQVVIFLVCGGMAGQFRDFLASHLRRMHALSGHHQARLAQFSSAFHLLQLSHSQLERRLGGTAISLRTSMQQLKTKLQTTGIDKNLPLGGIGGLLLEFLAEMGNIHVASIYAMDYTTHYATNYGTKERGELASAPVSMMGDAPELPASHPLLLEALDTCSVTSVRADSTGTGDVIAIVPLTDSHRHIHGVVCINVMPFVSIHQRTFNLLGIIARQMGDMLGRYSDVEQGVRSHQTLRSDLKRALHNAQHDELPVALIAYKILEPGQQESLIRLCLEVTRGIDQSWQWHDSDGRPVIINLLVMAGEAIAGLQLQRLRQRIMELHGNVIATEGLQSTIWEIKADQDVDKLVDKVFLACDIAEPEHDLDVPQSTAFML